jgi:hypothetical protein
MDPEFREERNGGTATWNMKPIEKPIIYNEYYFKNAILPN